MCTKAFCVKRWEIQLQRDMSRCGAPCKKTKLMLGDFNKLKISPRTRDTTVMVMATPKPKSQHVTCSSLQRIPHYKQVLVDFRVPRVHSFCNRTTSGSMKVGFSHNLDGVLSASKLFFLLIPYFVLTLHDMSYIFLVDCCWLTLG